MAKLKDRFNIERIALLGDHGMLTTAHICQCLSLPVTAEVMLPISAEVKIPS